MARKRINAAALPLALALVGIIPALAADEVVYVDDDAPRGGNGTSWGTAYRYLQDALAPLKARSSVEPVEVRVAQGIYRPDQSEENPKGSRNRIAVFEITPGGRLVGGYAGIGAADPNLRDIAAYRTILSGDLAGNDAEVRDPGRLGDDLTRTDNSQRVVAMAGPALMEGVTITGGHAPSFRIGNILPDVALSGGGAWAKGAGTIIRECLFFANFASGGGGGLLLEDLEAHGSPYPEVLLERCAFDRNIVQPGPSVGQGHGGAFLLWGGRAIIRDCVFRDNFAAWGGCVANSGPGGYVEIVNCLAVGNIASGGGAVLYNANSPAKLQNCTAAGNRASEGRFLSDDTARPGRGEQPPSIHVENCILANDSNEISNGYAALTIRYTDVVDGRAAVRDPQRAMTWGSGNISVDPCFVDSGYWDSGGTPTDPNDDFFVAGDYHLRSRAGRWDSLNQAWAQDGVTSPCIDAGNPATSFEHEPVPNGSRVNMGFYGGAGEASKSVHTWQFITTQGPLLAEGLGVILPHEHIFTDLRGPTTSGYGQANPADVVRMMKPLLAEARQKGVGVLFECTSIGVGRNVPIIARVSQESGLPVVVPTGVYGRESFAPPEHQRMTEDQLTTLFVKELTEGIEGTGIKAGFIKIATGGGAMTALEEKFLRAAGRAAGQTGAAIASHTPVSSNASRQITILESIAPTIRFIWVHAQSENNRQIHCQLAARGVYIEFDNLGWNPGQDGTVIAAIQELLAAGYGDRILLSHDAGWYQPGQPNGGSQKGYAYLIETFLPKLRAASVDEAAIRMITEINPIRALGLKSSL